MNRRTPPTRGSASLRRPGPSRSAKRRVLVLCEGSETEPTYLRFIATCATSTLVEIDDNDLTSPKQLVDRACRLLAESKSLAEKTADPNALYDEVWCMFDVDVHPMIHEALNKAASSGVRLAVSNPCVELWFLLHFQNQSAYIECASALHNMKQHSPSYSKSSFAFLSLQGRYADAKGRAQQLEAKHLGDRTAFPQNNPSSDVWRLIEAVGATY